MNFRTYIIFIFLFISISCVSAERNRESTDGHDIPGRRILETQIEYKCEALFSKGIKEIEQLINQFGRSGWELASFINRDGDAFAFCMKRRRL